jgi:competence protein ComEC
MFSVGEGEAILVIFPGGRTWLIDGGTSNNLAPNEQLGQLLVGYLEGRGLTLEACVPSHPHVDHAGALATILTSGSAALAPKITVYRAAVAWAGTAKWLERYHQAIAALGPAVEEVVFSATDPLSPTHQEAAIADGVAAHLFAGSGAGPYTSIFMQLRFHSARLLFTGDSHCAYEVELLETFGEADLRADMLKVTHHGSSSGTAGRVLTAVKPAFAIASTADEGGHRLEQDTLDRLLGAGKKRQVFETLVDGDITVRTDGEPYRGGILYRVEFVSPAEFANELATKVMPADQIQRTRGNDPHCQ